MDIKSMRKVVLEGGKPAYFHLWLKKALEDEMYKTEYAYALIELEDGKMIEVRFSELRFVN